MKDYKSYDELKIVMNKIRQLPEVQNLFTALTYAGFKVINEESILITLTDYYDEDANVIEFDDKTALIADLQCDLISEDAPISRWIENTIILDRPEFADLRIRQDDLFDLKEEMLSLIKHIDEKLGNKALFEIILYEKEPEFYNMFGQILDKWLADLVTGDFIEKIYHRLHQLVDTSSDLELREMCHLALSSFYLMNGRDNPYPIYLLIKSLMEALNLDLEKNYRLNLDYERKTLKHAVEDGLYVALINTQDGRVIVENEAPDEPEEIF